MFFNKYYIIDYCFASSPFTFGWQLRSNESSLSKSLSTPTTTQQQIRRFDASRVESFNLQLNQQIVQHWTSSKPVVINSYIGKVLTNINIRNSSISHIIYFSILFLLFPLMHVLWYIPNFWYAPPQKLKINHFFGKMMYYSCLVLVVLLSHHSLGFALFYSSSSLLLPSSDWNYLFSLVAYKFSCDVITVIFNHT